MESARYLCRAEVVYNGIGTPRTGAAVMVESTRRGTRVVAVDDAEALERSYPEAQPLDAGFAIAPAPVNAHTHLDLSRMPGVRGSYVEFVTAVVGHGRAGMRGVAAAEDGVAASVAAGVETVGDIVTDPEVMRMLLGDDRLSGVAYWEVLGPNPSDADRIASETVERLRAFRRLERPGGMRVGLAPHAAHTVSGPLLAALAKLATANDLPLQVHVAESPAETRLFREGRGPLAEWLERVGAPFEPPGVSPVSHLDRLGVLEARPTLVHMVEVDEEDVRRVQRSGCVVVHCPRSNEALGSGRFPWELYARHSVTVGFGTDSLGSAPTLSPLDDVAAAREAQGDRVNPVGLVWAAVKGGHRALRRKPPIVTRGMPAGSLSAWLGSAAVPLDVFIARHGADAGTD